MFNCAAALAQNAEFEADRTIPALIRLQRIVENIREVYYEDRKAGAVLRMPIHAPRFIADLDEWRSTLPQNLRETGMYSDCVS